MLIPNSRLPTRVVVKADKSAPVGRCIYCGSVSPPLTDDHIIPEGLGGKHFLPNASCKSCEKITCRFEGEVLQGMLHPIRRTIGVPGKKRKRKDTIRTQVVTGHSAVIWDDINPDQAGLKGVVPDFRHPPGIFGGQQRNSFSNLNWFYMIDPDKVPALEEKGNVLRVNMFSFVRMLTKIAHAEAAFVCGIDGFAPFLAETILGQDGLWPNFVGCSLDQSPLCDAPYCSWVTAYKLPHKRIAGDALVSVRIHVLAQLGLPVYQVVAGRLRPSAKVDVHREPIRTYVEGLGWTMRNTLDLSLNSPDMRRNDFCYCGSGLRYKRCHGHT